MMKTVKGKLVAGAITVALVSSAGGVVFGASDAGSKLKNWYDVQFGDAKKTIEAEADAVWKDSLETESKEIGAMIGEAKTEIANKGDEQIDQKGKSIQAAADSYIDNLKQERDTIIKGMTAQFDKIEKDAEAKFQSEGQVFAEKKKDELTKGTGEAGRAASEKLDKELQAVTDQALKDLRDTINGVKGELVKELNSNSIRSKEAMVKAVDREITRIHGVIEGEKKKLVKQYEIMISKAAQVKEDNAKTEMEKVINGI
ncbi:hypothetical protein [Bhargavaea cecembensis]|uniref:hypothetical protein n=1 Tax=Bhargavaea cecembensis TaxID=394098 RepID=UPI00058C30D2|nr:hypothetical protein [Bhargavaea cecembensis]